MIKVSTPNLKSIIRQIEVKQKSLKTDTGELLDELAKKGSEVLAERLSNASYTGDMYAEVMQPERDGNRATIGIKGESVTFIEFGTGTYYPDNHPLMDEFGYERGTFGKGLGANPPWYFHNDGGRTVRSFGNEANRVVYNTARDMERELEEIAKEVYSK